MTDRTNKQTDGASEVARVRARSLGCSPESVEKLRHLFEADIQRFAGPITDDVLTAAAGYWIGYPEFLVYIGHDRKGDQSRIMAYYVLNHVHHRATQLLMQAAERAGIDSGPLWLSATLCQDILAREPWRCYNGRYQTWPACLGYMDDLPPDVRETIRAGDAVFMRLCAKSPAVDDVALTDTEKGFLRALAGSEEEYLTANKIIDAFSRGNMSEASTYHRDVLSGLVGKGYLTKPARGRGSQGYSLTQKAKLWIEMSGK